MPLLTPTDRGLYCAAGDFYVDPWAPVPRAVVTHAHGDHLAWGSEHYLIAERGRGVTEWRLGGRSVQTAPWGVRQTIGSATVSFHPAGHILGSAQIRIEHAGEVWVVSGDYKTEPDRTCDPFEPVTCHTFVTESTFGLPIYRWPGEAEIVQQLCDWCADNRASGRASVVMGYALGKAQRLIAMLGEIPGTIWTHGAVETMTALYRSGGVTLPPTVPVSMAPPKSAWHEGVIVAPPSAQGSPWLRRFGDPRVAFASGWMLVRGARRRRNLDRGFALSDHVDWPALFDAVAATGATQVYATHGFTDVVQRRLTELGLDAGVIATRWEGERDDAPEPAAADSE